MFPVRNKEVLVILINNENDVITINKDTVIIVNSKLVLSRSSSAVWANISLIPCILFLA